VPRGLEHDPEKWVPVFGKDHAPKISGRSIKAEARTRG
jgi:hypothetical protein